MAETDWTGLANNQPGWPISVTVFQEPVDGSKPYALGMHNTTGAEGAAGGYPLLVDYSPIVGVGSGSIRALMFRRESVVHQHSPVMAIHLPSPDVLDTGYFITFEDAEEARLVLVKGPINDGVEDPEVGVNGVLAISTKTYSYNTWYHFKLETLLVGLNTEIRIFESNPQDSSIFHPVWEDIDGLPPYTDTIGPLSAGFFALAMWSRNEGDVAFFDFVELTRHKL